jgi:transmembrane sensor
MAGEAAQEIDLAAAEWVARADRGLSPEEELALETWLSGDPRRLGAYGRMRAIFLSTERASELADALDLPGSAPGHAIASPGRRRLLLAGGGVLAAGLAATVGVGLTRHEQRYATALGEVSFVPLADGSVLGLNTASLVEVVLTETRRSVRLIRGEVLFDVAMDIARLFVVDAGDALVYAVGSSFTVSRLAEAPVEVLVRSGMVEVTQRLNRAESAPLEVTANSLVVAPHSGKIATTSVEPARITRLLAWREGRLAFEGETLAEASAQFARYSDTRIVIADRTLAAEKITGLFQANDPIGFAQAVASSFDLRAVVGAGEVRLVR